MLRRRSARTGPLFLKTGDGSKTISVIAEAVLRGAGRTSPTRIYIIDEVGVQRHRIRGGRSSRIGLMFALLLFGPLQYLLTARRRKRITMQGTRERNNQCCE